MNEARRKPMNPIHSLDRLADQTRRHFLREGSLGLGGLALARLLGTDHPARPAPAVDDPFAPGLLITRPRSRTLSSSSMSGGPPHLDLFDYKPELVRRDGQDCPDAR